MAISVDWPSRVISVPKADMTMITATLYELDVDVFRLALKDLEDDEAGIPYPTTHNHNTEVTVGGVTLARVVEIINDYTITFEAGSYFVRLTGANNNIGDVMNLNGVSLLSANSAGLVNAGQITSIDPAAADDIANAIFDQVNAVENSLTFREALKLMAAAMAGKVSGGGTTTITFRNAVADTKNRIVATVDANGNRTAIVYDVS